ncbi:uncharacterized protein NEMAJ01_1563 [Nematocida major]|uniref:uncharacterized protein n=1 Tax=Nematocida major TaxID=1912982 RepID=UPI0020072412|nr:uncharacterized protein NEMAJ01_1563 [Nematocida major]KAH9386667.1 hypothetical protein NEMAJ01_1563 [Nematocida major]
MTDKVASEAPVWGREYRVHAPAREGSNLLPPPQNSIIEGQRFSEIEKLMEDINAVVEHLKNIKDDLVISPRRKLWKQRGEAESVESAEVSGEANLPETVQKTSECTVLEEAAETSVREVLDAGKAVLPAVDSVDIVTLENLSLEAGDAKSAHLENGECQKEAPTPPAITQEQPACPLAQEEVFEEAQDEPERKIPQAAARTKPIPKKRLRLSERKPLPSEERALESESGQRPRKKMRSADPINRPTCKKKAQDYFGILAEICTEEHLQGAMRSRLEEALCVLFNSPNCDEILAHATSSCKLKLKEPLEKYTGLLEETQRVHASTKILKFEIYREQVAISEIDMHYKPLDKILEKIWHEQKSVEQAYFKAIQGIAMRLKSVLYSESHEVCTTHNKIRILSLMTNILNTAKIENAMLCKSREALVIEKIRLKNEMHLKSGDAQRSPKRSEGASSPSDAQEVPCTSSLKRALSRFSMKVAKGVQSVFRRQSRTRQYL